MATTVCSLKVQDLKLGQHRDPAGDRAQPVPPHFQAGEGGERQYNIWERLEVEMVKAQGRETRQRMEETRYLLQVELRIEANVELCEPCETRAVRREPGVRGWRVEFSSKNRSALWK